MQMGRALSGGGVWPLAASSRQQLVNTATYGLRQQVQADVQLSPSLPGLLIKGILVKLTCVRHVLNRDMILSQKYFLCTTFANLLRCYLRNKAIYNCLCESLSLLPREWLPMQPDYNEQPCTRSETRNDCWLWTQWTLRIKPTYGELNRIFITMPYTETIGRAQTIKSSYPESCFRYVVMVIRH